MSPSVQRLLLDHIRRGGWYWLLVGFMQVIAALNYAVSPRTTAIAFPMMGALFAPMILGVAEQRGWFQALMTLPLSRREIARARWWAAIGMPGLFLTTLSLAAFIVFPALGWRLRDPSWQTVLWLLSGWAILGLFAQARSWLRVKPGGTVTARRALVAGGYLTLAIPVLFFAGADGYLRLLAIAATMFGLVVDAYLCWCAERLLFWQVGRRGDAISSGKELRKAAVASFGAGWSALMGQWGRRLAIFAAFICLGLGLLAGIDRAEGGGLFAFMAVSMLGLLVVLSCLLASPWLSAARVFRALPLSADRLAAAFLAMAMTPAWLVLVTILAVSVLAPEMGTSLFAPFGLLAAATAALLVPILLRYGQQKAVAWVAIPIIAVPPILDPMLPIFHPEFAAMWMRPLMSAIIAIAVITAYLSFLWTRHELRAGRGAYRVATPPGANLTA